MIGFLFLGSYLEPVFIFVVNYGYKALKYLKIKDYTQYDLFRYIILSFFSWLGQIQDYMLILFCIHIIFVNIMLFVIFTVISNIIGAQKCEIIFNSLLNSLLIFLFVSYLDSWLFLCIALCKVFALLTIASDSCRSFSISRYLKGR